LTNVLLGLVFGKEAFISGELHDIADRLISGKEKKRKWRQK